MVMKAAATVFFIVVGGTIELYGTEKAFIIEFGLIREDNPTPGSAFGHLTHSFLCCYSFRCDEQSSGFKKVQLILLSPVKPPCGAALTEHIVNSRVCFLGGGADSHFL